MAGPVVEVGPGFLVALGEGIVVREAARPGSRGQRVTGFEPFPLQCAELLKGVVEDAELPGPAGLDVRGVELLYLYLGGGQQVLGEGPYAVEGPPGVRVAFDGMTAVLGVVEGPAVEVAVLLAPGVEVSEDLLALAQEGGELLQTLAVDHIGGVGSWGQERSQTKDGTRGG
ncbi:hypothetical protein [Streptomyces sp. NPDC003006]